MRIPYVRDDHTYKFAKGAKDLVYTLYRAYKQTAGAGAKIDIS